jgi:pimeloyl-ACP methyl ester carboxylesterase
VWEIEGDDPAGPVVILTHGWADSRIGGLARANAVAAVASRLILWDLAGHGESPGVSHLGTAEITDLGALVDLLRSPGRQQSGNSPIVLYGWSLGAGVSIVVAARSTAHIAAVVAESPYRLPETPALNVLRARSLPHRLTLAPALWLVGALTGVGPGFRPPSAPSPRTSVFDRAVHAARLTCPLLVLHGTDDEVCPIEDGRAIAAAAPKATLGEIPGARHNDLWTEPQHAERAAAAVQSFVRKLQPGGPCGVV